MKPTRHAAALLWLVAAALCAQPALADRFQSNVTAAQEQQLDNARNLRRTGQIGAAIPLFQQLLKENPEYYLASYNLALAYADSNKHDLAVAQFAHAAAVQGKYRITDPTLFNSLGWAQLIAGDYSGAEVAFMKAEAQFGALNPESQRRLLNNMGVLYQYKKDYERAEVYFKRAASDFSSSLARDNLRSNQMLQQQQQQQQIQRANSAEQVNIRGTTAAR